MKIATLGWGAFIWEPHELHLTSDTLNHGLLATEALIPFGRRPGCHSRLAWRLITLMT
jgi:hypothetical protein